MTGLRATAVVRAKDKAATIERTFQSLRRQSVPVEIVLVDSGSTDDTLAIGHRYADKIVELPSNLFSYGRALNRGAAVADGDIIFALSAHSAPASDTWVEQSLGAYSDDIVAATTGALDGPDGKTLSEAITVRAHDLDLCRRPQWGLSNHAASWRRSVWEQFPFEEELVAAEDKEWMWRVLQAGHAIVADPELYVGTGHRRDDGVRALYARCYREGMTLAALVDFPVDDVRTLARRWWSEFTYESPRPRWQRRLSVMRAAEMFGEWRGNNAGARRRDEQTFTQASLEGRDLTPS